LRRDATGAGPQVRERYFFIGIRRDLAALNDNFDPFKIIEEKRKRFLDDMGFGNGDLPISVGDAISDLARKTTVEKKGARKFKATLINFDNLG